MAFAQVLDHDFVGLDRASALQRFLADKAARIGQPLRLRVQLRSFDAVCRLVECNVGIGIVPETTARRVARTMAIVAVALTDPWAVRELTICIRNIERAAALCPPAGRAPANGGLKIARYRPRLGDATRTHSRPRRNRARFETVSKKSPGELRQGGK